MKSYQKLGNSYFEVDSARDVLEFIWLKLMTYLVFILVWMAGFMVGAFCIYYLLAHFDRILLFLADVCDNLRY
jgi:hypothetical protein